MKICPQCNEKFDDDTNFCLTDGTVLISESLHKAAVSQPDAETVVKKDIPVPSGERPRGASKFTKTVLALLIASVAVGGLGFAFMSFGRNSFNSYSVPTKLGKEEMEILLKDFSPIQLKQISEDPEQKKMLVDNIKELLAIASQAQKEGVLKDPGVQSELESIDASILAVSYDRKLNEGKEPGAPFGQITEEQVKKFWDATDTPKTFWDSVGLGENNAESRKKKFQDFIDRKLAMARKSGQIPEDKKPSEEELKQARDAFAKTRIYYNEAKRKIDNVNSLPEAEKKDWLEFKKKYELHSKLQMAQFVTQKYVQDVLNKKFEVTDKEIDKYVKEHPEMSNADEKLKKAREVLDKINSGGDFAALAKEFSEDPGSKDKGGLYEGVAKGQFDPAFEVAALSLKPGEVTKEPVKTNFGYHIIKLVKKNEKKDAQGNPQETYDVRHILFSTMIKDPEDPLGKEQPVEVFVKTKLEKEKQEKTLQEIKTKNPVEVADNFEIPKVSDEDIKKMQEEQQRQMQEMQKQLNQGKDKPAEKTKE